MELITRAELARIAGVSKPSITEAVRNKLAPACVGKGRALKIDATHPLITEYIDNARAGNKPAGKRSDDNGNGTKPPAPPAVTIPGLDVDIVDLEELTVKQVCMKYGGAPQFKDWVTALKNIAEYKNKELLARQRRGELIERETIAAALVQLIDSAFKRLVGELPASVTQQLVPLVLSGGEDSLKDAEKLLGDSISKILKDCKAELQRKLKAADKGGEHE